jgi:hypothetical protein
MVLLCASALRHRILLFILIVHRVLAFRTGCKVCPLMMAYRTGMTVYTVINKVQNVTESSSSRTVR